MAVVVFFIVKSESERSPGTDFAAEEDMKDNIRAIFVHIAANFRIECRENVRILEISNTNRIFVPSLVATPSPGIVHESNVIFKHLLLVANSMHLLMREIYVHDTDVMYTTGLENVNVEGIIRYYCVLSCCFW